jgi:hypothetical protein
MFPVVCLAITNLWVSGVVSFLFPQCRLLMKSMRKMVWPCLTRCFYADGGYKGAEELSQGVREYLNINPTTRAHC